jgi:hypothetical protein
MGKVLMGFFGSTLQCWLDKDVQCVKKYRVISLGKNILLETFENGKKEAEILSNHQLKDAVGVNDKTIVAYDQARESTIQDVRVVETYVGPHKNHKGMALGLGESHLVMQATSKSKVVLDNEIITLKESFISLEPKIKPQQQFIMPLLVSQGGNVQIKEVFELKSQTAVKYAYDPCFRLMHEFNMLKNFYGSSNSVIIQNSSGFYKQSYNQGSLYQFLSAGNLFIGNKFMAGSQY